MQPSPRKTCWKIVKHSCRGTHHVRQNLPNQDCVDSYALPDHSSPIILALADGHGNARSFRSHVGSTLAVTTAIAEVKKFYEGLDPTESPSFSVIKSEAETKLPRRIVDAWQKRVSTHSQRNPFTAEEVELLSKRGGKSGGHKVASDVNPNLAYGSTLLVALLADEYIVCLQLGDGDIVAVSDSSGEVTRLIAQDDKIANETDSLCYPDPVSKFRFYFRHFQNEPPGLVLLSTDGYFNSFEHGEDGFFRNCRSYLDVFRKGDPDSVARDLPTWLKEYTEEGSGDDISLGIIFRSEPPLLPSSDESQSTVGVSSHETPDLSGESSEHAAPDSTESQQDNAPTGAEDPKEALPPQNTQDDPGSMVELDVPISSSAGELEQSEDAESSNSGRRGEVGEDTLSTSAVDVEIGPSTKSSVDKNTVAHPPLSSRDPVKPGGPVTPTQESDLR